MALCEASVEDVQWETVDEEDAAVGDLRGLFFAPTGEFLLCTMLLSQFIVVIVTTMMYSFFLQLIRC